MKPNCNKCKHYFVTFDKYSPKGCRAYGIKTSVMPSQIVRQSNNGQECLGFELKDRLKNQKKEKDLNDPKNW
ncbi:MAG: hypothetical protein N4A33_11455 [Bacteriovoracaceae bacterium]|jgi:hypothetical protein|nr:hypothetical protein [Bacteriovoracaceae bacterium]